MNNGFLDNNVETILAHKHISFDLWLTLIKSHPDFKLKRAALFKSFFDIADTLENICSVIKYYDNTCNKINEVTGLSLDAFEIYLFILAKYNLYPSVDILEVFYQETENLLFQYPPLELHYFDTDFFKLMKDKGITANILSNTGFIKGRTLRPLISNYSMGQYFDFQLYSDEMGFSKPNKLSFEKIFSYFEASIPKKNVLHIGDNIDADYNGAMNAGLDALLITAVN